MRRALLAASLLLSCVTCGHVEWSPADTVGAIGVSIDVVGLTIEYIEHHGAESAPPRLSDGGPAVLADGGKLEEPPASPFVVLMACAPVPELGPGIVRCVAGGTAVKDGG